MQRLQYTATCRMSQRTQQRINLFGVRTASLRCSLRCVRSAEFYTSTSEPLSRPSIQRALCGLIRLHVTAHGAVVLLDLRHTNASLFNAGLCASKQPPLRVMPPLRCSGAVSMILLFVTVKAASVGRMSANASREGQVKSSPSDSFIPTIESGIFPLQPESHGRAAAVTTAGGRQTATR